SSDLRGGDVLAKAKEAGRLHAEQTSKDEEHKQLERPCIPPSSPVLKLKCASQSSVLQSGDVLSKSQSQGIYSIRNSVKEDEEAQLVTTPDLATENLKDATERWAEGSSPYSICKSAIGSGSNDRDGPEDTTLESAAQMNKKFLEEKGAHRKAKFAKLFCFAFFLAALAAGTYPFIIDMIANTSAVVETASPSASMAPSSSPSLSQQPSGAPSSNPSIYPTLSNIPTIAPSGLPTQSAHPTMAPTTSAAPTIKPSIVPTESLEPSGYPTEIPSTGPTGIPTISPSLGPTVSKEPTNVPSLVPSQKPSTGPTQHPTMTFQPSRYPTRSPTPRPTQPPTPSPTPSPTLRPTPRPTPQPTPSPTHQPIAPPPDNSFKIRLYWDPSYFWQETKEEAWWCLECVKCAEYGGMDAPDHGCVSYGTGDEGRCKAGDSIWVRDCRSRGNRFNVEKSAGREFMLRIATTNLCVERIRNNHPFLFLQGCDRNNPYQRFNPWNNYNKFELRPPGSRDCISQAHHPKSGELVSMHNCDLADRDETLYWERY
ncbi:MAG: hypothetical protein SGBAC_012395, partial [Bacillariaceae sp.]